MLCGLVLKTQDLIEEENFDKKHLGYVLIVVNVMVLVVAVSLAVIQFRRSNEEDYQSDSVVSIMTREFEIQNSTRPSDGASGIDSQDEKVNEKERGSSKFDFFSGLRKTVVRTKYGSKENMIEGGEGVQRERQQPRPKKKEKKEKKREMTMDEMMEASMKQDRGIELSDIYVGGGSR